MVACFNNFSEQDIDIDLLEPDDFMVFRINKELDITVITSGDNQGYIIDFRKVTNPDTHDEKKELITSIAIWKDELEDK